MLVLELLLSHPSLHCTTTNRPSQATSRRTATRSTNATLRASELSMLVARAPPLVPNSHVLMPCVCDYRTSGASHCGLPRRSLPAASASAAVPRVASPCPSWEPTPVEVASVPLGVCSYTLSRCTLVCFVAHNKQQQPPRPTSVTIRRPFKCACLCCCRPCLHVMDAADNVIGEVHNPYVTHKCSTPYRAPSGLRQ